jgi:anti-sigma regulatory factor (Ser/Thr protein kinase)
VPALLGEFDLPAIPTSVGVARARVLMALADAPVDAAAVAAALTEAVTNAVVHAYRSQPDPGRVRVAVTEREDAIEVTVSDDGTGLVPRPDSPGAGLGIPLMTSLADHVEIDTTTGTRVCLRFAFTATSRVEPVRARRFARDTHSTAAPCATAGRRSP